MTNLNEIHYFLHVADAGGFTAAAQMLGVPKSTVSRGITRLEQRLGIRLLERTTRRMSLTEAGEVYLEHCRQALEQVHQAEVAISTIRGTPRGRFRVGAPFFFSRLFLTPLLPEFMRSHPDLQLHLVLGHCERNLLECNLDMLIRTGRIDDSDMFVRPLGQLRLGLYAATGYVEAHGAPASPADLPLHACLMLKEHGERAMWRFRNGREEIEIRPQPRVSAADSAILHQFVLDGVGIALIPCALAQQDLDSGRLVHLLPQWQPDPVEISAVYPSRLSLMPKVNAFLTLLTDRLAIE